VFDFAKRLSGLGDATVLCVGDLMLDTYVYGEVERISPEAPAQVLAVRREDIIVGGAGNVARNVAALGARCIFAGVVGDDLAGQTLETAFGQEARIESHLVVDRTRPTTRKTRFVSEHHSTHLLRADWEMIRPIGGDIEAAVIDAATSALSRAEAIVLSDYSKGVLTPSVVRAVIAAARKHDKPVVVDPKYGDYSVYRGTTLITPNRKELAAATRLPADSDAELARAAATLLDLVECEAALVTLSEHGMTLIARERPAVHVPSYPVKVLDVSGAGDTVVATLAAFLAAGAGYEEAMRAANAAASVVVGKRGTATVSLAELRARILPAATLAPEQKIMTDWSALDRRLAAWRVDELRIGFTNGCFDLLHPGHIKLLAEARAACDRLVVGLNSDASVKRLKGNGRPVQHQAARAEVLAALAAVDLVVLFDEDTPLELIRRVRPNVLVKGADYRVEQVVGRNVVEAEGGEVILVELVPGCSTSALIGRSLAPAKDRHGSKT
jgi:D-beta-D-heptose 7-phosphate kinase / D-beta-D-heptose 1-phosphate adenosyltransferase